MCGVWRDCRRIHHCSYGRAQIQSCCQASQYRVCGDDEAILEGISVLDPCQPRSRGSTSRRSTHLLMDDASCTRTRLLFQEYLVAIENDKPLTAFGTSYLDMTDITLGLLRAAREEGWLLHFASIHAMIT